MCLGILGESGKTSAINLSLLLLIDKFTISRYLEFKPFYAVGGSCPILALHPDRAHHYSFGGLCHGMGRRGLCPKEALPFLLEVLPWFSLQ